MTELERLIAREFHRIYYSGGSSGEPIYRRTTWMGVPVMKCPLDLWIYQEILFQVRPKLIVETGTYMGGSALFLAHLCDLLGEGRIVTIDITEADRPTHPRIRYVSGSSTDKVLIDGIFEDAGNAAPVLVILDSDHSAGHVRRELELYAHRVTPGSYIVVEDTNVNGHPVEPGFGPGPHEAVQDFLRESGDFEADGSREKFLMTFNPGGFLRRKAPGEATSAVAAAGRTADEAVPGGPAEAAARLVADLEQKLDKRNLELQQTGEGLREAFRQMEAKDTAIAAFQDHIKIISDGFEEALRQLRAKDEVIAALQDQISKMAPGQ